MFKFGRLFLLCWLIAITFSASSYAQVVAKWSPATSGAMSGGFYSNLKEFNWFNPSNWSWTVNTVAADPTHASVPDNGIPDENTVVMIPTNTPICWIPEDYTAYCIDKTTNPASPTLGNAPCASNFEAATRPICKSITIEGALYNQASLNNNSDTKSLYIKDVNGTSEGNFTINSGGVYLSEAFVTKVEGNFTLNTGGYLVVYGSDNTIRINRNFTIDGHITKQGQTTGRTLTIDFRGKESSTLNGSHWANQVSTAQISVAPYMDFSHYYTYGAVDNLTLSKSKNDPLNTADPDPTVTNDPSFPILVGIMNNAGTSLSINGTGNLTINGGSLVVKNVTSGGFTLGSSTFTGADTWTWDVPASDINVRGKIFIANANVGTSAYSGASLDLTGGSNRPRDICMHLGGNFEDLNIAEPSRTNGVRNGFYINGSKVGRRTRQWRRPTVVFNGDQDQDIRGINGLGTTFWLRDYNDNPTEGVGIAFPEVIVHKPATKKVSINASTNLRIFGDLRLLSGIFDVNGRTLLFGDYPPNWKETSGQTADGRDEINIYGVFNAPEGSVIKMSGGWSRHGTIIRVREGGLLKILGSASNNNTLMQDGKTGHCFRLAVYGGGTMAMAYTSVQGQLGRFNSFYGLNNTNYFTDADNAASGNGSLGGFKIYDGAKLLHIKENVLTGELDLVDMNSPTFSSENPTTFDADYSSFSYCGFSNMFWNGAHLTINTGQKLLILNAAFGGAYNGTGKNIINNNTSVGSISVEYSSGSIGGTKGETNDGGLADDKVIWKSLVSVYWWGPPTARGADKQWDTGLSGKRSRNFDPSGVATYLWWDGYYRDYIGGNPTLPSGASGNSDYHASLWSSVDAAGVSNVWSLSPDVWEPLPAGVIPGTAGNEDYNVYILERSSRHVYVDADYTLNGGIYMQQPSNNGLVRAMRVLYLDPNTSRTLTVKKDLITKIGWGYGVIYGGKSTVNIGGHLKASQGILHPETSHFVFNGSTSQEIRLGTNSFYDLTINKPGGFLGVQGIGGAIREGVSPWTRAQWIRGQSTFIVRNDFLLQSGDFALTSGVPMLVMKNFIQTGGKFYFNQSVVDIQGDLNITGGGNDDGGTTTAALVFTPSDNSPRSIRTGGLKFSNIYFNKLIYNSGRVGSRYDLDIVGAKSINEPRDVVYKVKDNLETLNKIEVDENRIVEIVGGKKMITGEMTIRDKGQMTTGTATEIQIKSGGKLNVNEGGFLQLIGSFSEYTKLTHDPSSSGTYEFNVNGTLKARYFLLEYMNKNGVNIGPNAKILSPGTIVQGGGGENYSSNPSVTIVGGGGLGATTDGVVSTSVTKIDLANGGVGYLTAPTVTIGGSPTVAATATASIKGGVTGIYITNTGAGYDEMPSVSFANGAGISAVGYVTGNLDQLNITNAGSGYATPPVVSLVDVGGGNVVNGTATATITGHVGKVNVNNAGSGYATFPTHSIRNPDSGGSGLAVTLQGSVTGFINLAKGSGYTTATATVSAPSGGGTTATADVVISTGELDQITVTTAGTGYLAGLHGTFPVLISGGSGTGATALAYVYTGNIYEIEVTDRGTGYQSTDVLTLDFTTHGGGGVNAAATCSFDDVGKIVGLNFTNNGSGYTSIPTITITGDGSNASADATISITQVAITNPGAGYHVPPSVYVGNPDDPEGVTTKLTAIISAIVTDLTIDTEGSGYTKTPLMYIESPAANGTVATSSGVITGVTITSAGTGYTSAPTVTFVDPKGFGTGATGTATIVDGKVTSVTVTSTGNNTYSDLTRVIIGTPAGVSNATGTTKIKATQGIISNPGTNYTAGFDVIFSGGNPTTPAAAKATLSVTSITVTNSGNGYATPPTVTVSDPVVITSFPNGLGDADPAVANAATIGSISSFNITNSGTGYTGTPFVIIKDITGRGAEGKVLLNPAPINKLLVLDGGKNYTSAPSISITGGGGAGATATATISSGEVTNIVITDGGSGYGAPPTITLTGGGGSGATAEAVVIGGKVVSIGMVNYGAGYTSAPTVDITGGSPTVAATATAEIGGRVTDITLTNPGSGYTGTPTVTFSGGGANAIDAVAVAHLTPTTIASITPTTTNIYPVASFSDGIFTNATEDGSTFITFPDSYSAYRNGTNEYSMTGTVASNITHDYVAKPAIDTIYNAVFPSNPDPILVFSNRPSNVKRTGTNNDPKNRVVFKDAIGTFSGEDFDSETVVADNGDNSLGINPFGIKADSMILWREPNVIRWDGGLTGAGTAWNDPTNWRPDRVPGPSDFVIIDHRFVFLQWNLLKGPPDVISPSNFVIDMNLNANTNPITCRNLTIETLLPEPNDGSKRSPIKIEVNRPLTILENLTISKEATIEVMSNAATVSVGGSWSNEGTFKHGGGTVKFNQPFTRVIKAMTSSVSFDPNADVGTPNDNLNAFFNLEIQDGTTDLNSYVRVENDLKIQNTNTKLGTSNHSLEIWGNWQNEGTFDPDNGTVYFGANLNQNIGKGYRTEATVTAALTGDAVSSTFTITNAGDKYAQTPVIMIEGGEGTGATATATIDASGQLTAVTLTNGGSGYTSVPTVRVVAAETEKFFNLTVYKSNNNVITKNRVEILDAGALSLKTQKIISKENAEVVLGLNASWIRDNGYVDGPVGRVYNSASSLVSKSFPVGKGSVYPGDNNGVTFAVQLTATPTTPTTSVMYIVEQFESAAVDGRIFPPNPSDNINYLSRSRHWKVRQGRYPDINSVFPTNGGTEVNFTKAKIGLPFNGLHERADTQIPALTNLSGLPLGTMVTDLNLAQLAELRILKDPGGVGTASDDAKGLLAETPTLVTNGLRWSNIGGGVDDITLFGIGSASLVSNEFSSLGTGTFTLGWNYTALPIDLLSFEGQLVRNKVQLKWVAQNEKEVKLYQVERSSDGVKFEVIGSVDAQTSEQDLQTYTFVDQSPKKGMNYYRIRQVDQYETSKISKIVDVEVNTARRMEVYPNPVTKTAHLQVLVPAEVGDKVKISVLDIKGNLMYHKTYKEFDGAPVGFTGLQLPKGVYLIKASINDGVNGVKQQRIVVL